MECFSTQKDDYDLSSQCHSLHKHKPRILENTLQDVESVVDPPGAAKLLVQAVPGFSVELDSLDLIEELHPHIYVKGHGL